MAKQPDYRIRVRVGENWQDAGVIWINPNGNLGIVLNLGALGQTKLVGIKRKEDD